MYNSLDKFSSSRKPRFAELELDVKFVRDGHLNNELSLQDDQHIISFVNPLEISYMIHRNQLTYRDNKLFVNGIKDLQYAQLYFPLDFLVEKYGNIHLDDTGYDLNTDFMLSWGTSLEEAIVSKQTDYITYRDMKFNSNVRWEINNFWKKFGDRLTVKQPRTKLEYESLYAEIYKVNQLWKEERTAKKKLFGAALGSQTYALKTMYNYLPSEKLRIYLFYIDEILHGVEVDYVHQPHILSDAFIGRFLSKHRETGEDLGRFGSFAQAYVIRYSPEVAMNLGSGTPRKGVWNFKEKFAVQTQEFIYNNVSKLMKNP